MGGSFGDKVLADVDAVGVLSMVFVVQLPVLGGRGYVLHAACLAPLLHSLANADVHLSQRCARFRRFGSRGLLGGARIVADRVEGFPLA